MKIGDKITDVHYNKAYKDFEDFSERIDGTIYKIDSKYVYVMYDNEKCKYDIKLLEKAIENNLIVLTQII